MFDPGAKKPQIAFFGTPDFAVWVLERLKERGIVPDLVVSAPDAPKGRKLVLTPPPAKAWAEKNRVPVLQPENVRGAGFEAELRGKARAAEGGLGYGEWDLFIVAAYGKLIPDNIFNMPRRKTINVHPSLLPRFRGAAPLQASILADARETGTTIIRLDKELDHGPILAQRALEFPVWPVDAETLGHMTARLGADLIAEILPQLLDGTAKEAPQDHSKATFTKKISKEEGQIDLSADGYQNFLKFQAHKGWPGSYLFVQRHHEGATGTIRVNISEAAYENGAFVIKKVVPEGKKEMSWDDFNRGA
ncbi:MAG TPA: methionyl-tRNA formyltransferase [Candidatus Paceibacterota bacterium]|nr:methionyl-tRNA formyltransferase [Candidatus Paceibacterota bacterium]